MSFHALQSSSQLTIRGALRPVETTQKRAVGSAVRSQKHTLGGQQLAMKSTTSKMVSRSTGLEVMAVEKPVLPYDVGSQGGVGILNPTKLPVSVGEENGGVGSKRLERCARSPSFNQCSVLEYSAGLVYVCVHPPPVYGGTHLGPSPLMCEVTHLGPTPCVMGPTWHARSSTPLPLL
jgi:hypothetical protein